MAMLFKVKVTNRMIPSRNLTAQMTLEEIGDNFPEFVELVRLKGFEIVVGVVDYEEVVICATKSGAQLGKED